jgi:uncharacterized phage protein (TIGR02218 family)
MENLILFLQTGKLKLCNGFNLEGIQAKDFKSFPYFHLQLENENNLTVINFLKGRGLSEEDIFHLHGKRAEFFYYSRSTKKIISKNSGIVSKIISTDLDFKMEISSLSILFENKVCHYFSPTCRANVGDDRCGANLNKYKIIEGFSANLKEIYDSGLKLDNSSIYSNGKIVFKNNENDFLLVERVFGGKILLFFDSFINLYVGQEYFLFSGCNKTLKMCGEVYKNRINFRGEPFIFDKLL